LKNHPEKPKNEGGAEGNEVKVARRCEGGEEGKKPSKSLRKKSLKKARRKEVR